MRNKCPGCDKLLIDAAGPKKAPVLLIGEFPGRDEIIKGIPFIGITGDILRAELGRVGIQMTTCRATNLWQHQKDEKGCNAQWHIDEAMKEIAGRKFVLALGSDVTRALWDLNVMDIAGVKMKHKMFPGTVFYPCPNPALLLHGPVGELRIAFERFAKEIK